MKYRKSKKLGVVIAMSMVLALTACSATKNASDTETVDVLAEESAGTEDAKEGMQDGERPELPDGEMPELQDGERPELPDGEMPELQDGERPELPDGEMPEGGMRGPGGRNGEMPGDGQTPPELSDTESDA
ncbi:MAG: hypothetical protein K6E81_06715 [Lachnospiraceae bacterium]|nr:hypothetical protein [Lachnospiraceae bacterium]